MTLKEANNKLENIDNQIEYYLNKKEVEITKLMPKSMQIKDVVVDGGKRVDKFGNYAIEIEEIDKEIDRLYADKKITEDFIDKELHRLKKYDETVQLIVYYKEQSLEKLEWWKIAQKVHYSKDWCRKKYRDYKKKRDID